MIKLTALGYNQPIMINTKLVTAIEPFPGPDGDIIGTIIYFDQGNEIKVRESFDLVGSRWPTSLASQSLQQDEIATSVTSTDSRKADE